MVASQDADTPITDLTVFISNTAGGFSEGFHSQISTGLDAITLFDADGDDLTDLVAGEKAQLLSGNGDGSFKPAVQFVYLGRSYMSYGDLDEDGLNDIFITISRGGTSSNSDPYVLFGSSDPTYPNREKFTFAGTLLQGLTARLQNPDIIEFVAISDKDEVEEETKWFRSIRRLEGNNLTYTEIGLPAGTLGDPVIPYDLNGDGLDELVFVTETGVSAFQRTRDVTGGRTTSIFTAELLENVQPGLFFSDGSAGLAAVNSGGEVVLARSSQGALPTATPDVPPTPSPTPFLFPTSTPAVDPTPTPSPSPTPGPVLEFNPDLNGDGIVDRDDLLIFMRYWGQAFP